MEILASPQCMHGNPVKRRLVKSPADWLCSSWRPISKTGSFLQLIGFS